MEDAIQDLLNALSEWSTSSIPDFGVKLVIAVLLVIIGRYLARLFVRWMVRVMRNAKVDETLVKFSEDLVYYIILAILVISALGVLGFPTTSLIAILGAGSLAIGLALQDSLANFASGILIIVIRPYRVNNLVQVAGESGFVEEIRFFHTELRTFDNQVLFIPNSDVMDNNILNYSEMDWIRLDLTYGIGYGDDLLKAKRILQEIVASDSRITSDPAPTVAVRELGDSSVNFAVRPYVKLDDMIDVTFDLTEAVKLRFDAEGISIPFPQRDVHVFSNQ